MKELRDYLIIIAIAAFIGTALGVIIHVLMEL